MLKTILLDQCPLCAIHHCLDNVLGCLEKCNSKALSPAQADGMGAANQHLSAVVVTLNTVLWGNFDGDGVFEFGFGPANSKPLPVTDFQVIELFAPDW